MSTRMWHVLPGAWPVVGDRSIYRSQTEIDIMGEQDKVAKNGIICYTINMCYIRYRF